MVPLADLLTDPAKVKDIPAAIIPAMLVQVAAVQAALAVRLLEVRGEESPKREEVLAGDGDKWLTVEEADAISGLGVRWIYRNWESVWGAKKFSHRRLRFHESAFRKWLKKGACLRGTSEPS